MITLREFIDKWKHKYPSMVKGLSSNDYPECVRQTIYCTKLIEGNNKQLKRSFKKKEQFPTEQSEEKYLVIHFNRYNEKKHESRTQRFWPDNSRRLVRELSHPY